MNPIQPVTSYPIISTIPSVDFCSRICEFTDLGQAIKLVMQVRGKQAGGKAREEVLRLGGLATLARCIKVNNAKDEAIDKLSKNYNEGNCSKKIDELQAQLSDMKKKYRQLEVVLKSLIDSGVVRSRPADVGYPATKLDPTPEE
ncbi:MAG TPA: hypothetical protein VGP47_08890 [Parachlamydiaceae bacterium]|nr:hypothetical protein [Parachlamydiaceae bacterium]